MMAHLVHLTASAILASIHRFGYPGIVALMALESACIPIPSEIVMTFSGYLVSTHALSLIGITLAGTLGSLLGSLAAYALGAYGGLPLLVRYGRYVLISERDLDRAHQWFLRYGQVAVFVGRLVPIVRTFISVPAGVAGMPLMPFLAYSAAGSFVWCAGLGWLGFRLGRHWQALGPYMHTIDVAVAIGAVLMITATLVRHARRPN